MRGLRLGCGCRREWSSSRCPWVISSECACPLLMLFFRAASELLLRQAISLPPSRGHWLPRPQI